MSRQSRSAVLWLVLMLFTSFPGDLTAWGEWPAGTVFPSEMRIDHYGPEHAVGSTTGLAIRRFHDRAAKEKGVVRGDEPGAYSGNPQIPNFASGFVGTTTASDRQATSFSRSNEASVGADRVAARSQTPVEWRRLEDRQVGYALLYPSEWSVEGQVAATEFATGSRCQSVRVVDFEPPPGSGPGAQIRHTFLQVCGKPVQDGQSLDDFMRRTYGALLERTFVRVDLNGLPAFRSREEQPTKVIFTQTKNHRIQIYVALVADPGKYEARKAQVEKILASFSAI